MIISSKDSYLITKFGRVSCKFTVESINTSDYLKKQRFQCSVSINKNTNYERNTYITSTLRQIRRNEAYLRKCMRGYINKHKNAIIVNGKFYSLDDLSLELFMLLCRDINNESI